MGPAPPLAADAPVGVFDSGIGGLSILRGLQMELPAEQFVYLADSGHAPYGERGPDHALARARWVLDDLRRRHAIKALVVACNTATTAAIDLLRIEHPDLPLVGVEPALKPALAQSRTRHVGVIGTRGTLQSPKFAALLAGLSSQGRVTVQPCDGLAHAIEQELLQALSRPVADAAMPDSTALQTLDDTTALCRRYLGAMGTFGEGPGEIDTLVLGCTHYPFAEPALRRALQGRPVQLIENGAPVARQTRRLLAERGLLSLALAGGVTLESTGDARLLQTAAARWLLHPAGGPEPATVAACA